MPLDTEALSSPIVTLDVAGKYAYVVTVAALLARRPLESIIVGGSDRTTVTTTAASVDTAVISESWREFGEELLSRLRTRLNLESAAHATDAVLSGEAPVDIAHLLPSLLDGDAEEMILSDLFLTGISLGSYDARTRILLLRFAIELGISRTRLAELEVILGSALAAQASSPSSSSSSFSSSSKSSSSAAAGSASTTSSDVVSAERRAAEKRRSRWRAAKIGAATILGGTLIGVTGGLAAPLVAAGAGAILGTAAGASLGTTAGIYVIGSLFAGYGAGLAGYKMSRRVGRVRGFEFKHLHPLPHAAARVTICVAGWVPGGTRTRDADPYFKAPFARVGYVESGCDKSGGSSGAAAATAAAASSGEMYYLAWEPEALAAVGTAFEDFLTQEALSYVATAVLQQTVLHALMAAVAWPVALTNLGVLIDNAWGTALSRARQAGVELASALLARAQGARPVRLVGVSQGARVVYFCLRELAQRSKHRGIVDEVVLAGAPVPGDPDAWIGLGDVVAGRIVNAYSRRDWVLKFLFRGTAAAACVAGCDRIALPQQHVRNGALGGKRGQQHHAAAAATVNTGHDFPYIENIDVSTAIASHKDYVDAEKLEAVWLRAGLVTRREGWPHAGAIGQRVMVAGHGGGILRFCGKLLGGGGCGGDDPPSLDTQQHHQHTGTEKKVGKESEVDAAKDGVFDYQKEAESSKSLLVDPVVDSSSDLSGSDLSCSCSDATATATATKDCVSVMDINFAEGKAASATDDGFALIESVDADEETWCGVALDQPLVVADGADGEYEGVRYFTCRRNHAIFIPISAQICTLDDGRANADIGAEDILVVDDETVVKEGGVDNSMSSTTTTTSAVALSGAQGQGTSSSIIFSRHPHCYTPGCQTAGRVVSTGGAQCYSPSCRGYGKSATSKL